MSFFTSLETDFDKIKSIFVSFFKHEPSWALVAETDLAFIAPVINTIITLSVGPAADVIAQQVLATIQKDLVLATKFIQAEDTSANLTDVLNTLKANLNGLLTLAGIKNNTEFSKISAYVTGVIAEIEAILAVIPKVL